jgi:SAM-dependent methyltransferase
MWGRERYPLSRQCRVQYHCNRRFAVALEKLMKLGKLHNFQDRIRPVKRDARCWMYLSDTFDLVTSATCLDHMPELDGQLLLEKITKCLKDSGILFVEVHTVDDPGFKHTEK